ncbi:hypothetical protein Tco_1206288 [Tanacetum coccineum]
MDYDHLYSEFDVGTARQSLLSLKEAEATKAISLRGQLTVLEVTDASKSAELRALKEKNFALEGEKNALCDRVEALESADASKEVELTSLCFPLIQTIAVIYLVSNSVMSLLQPRSSLESAFELFKEQVAVIVGRSIAGWRWLLNRGLNLVLSKCLSSPEYLSAMGEAIGRAIDKGIDKGDETARRLSLTDSIRPLVEPLSFRVLTGEASSSTDVIVTTALATTFAQTFPILVGASTEVPPSPKIVFEEEELNSTLKHALAS